MSVALLGLRVVLALACVLALIWLASRKLSGMSGLGKPRSIPLTVLGRQSLGKGSGIALVEVAGRVLLLGVGEQGVRVLTEIDVPAPAPVPTPLAGDSSVLVTSSVVADDATYVLREEIDLATLVGPYPDGPLVGELVSPHADGSDRLADDVPADDQVLPTTVVDPAGLAHLAGLAASSSARGASALHGSILSLDTWRRAVDVVQQRTVRR
ncbi:FliO/MopB family protein [Pengzhenrongella frigida]|uniref:Flagellar biosynthetic protein FliO n=1 Tax=Pengzhenrongella frigida TaxID=1259133 RepID=A0A4Q5N1W1_9MICO|nr:flagellar biosynthetic protein FliO [Cellulomonas sp. HLT2-17]RYV50011.1 hypothetical protein EUA98_15695 [Cellulomonas sp. HLT2-17]